MKFKFTAIVHHGTKIIKITEEIDADNTEHALFLIKTRHAENLVKVISLDTHTESDKTQTD
ncbi:MAG: hypothetical protein EBS90_08875 [Betaproteobacteria bacterium]|nr:hypothetical protein [Betaproteobacteria bacterium]